MVAVSADLLNIRYVDSFLPTSIYLLDDMT